MKFIQNQSVVMLDSLQRLLFPTQLAVVCLILPVLFLIGIKGNEGKSAPTQPTEKVHEYSVPASKDVYVLTMRP